MEYRDVTPKRILQIVSRDLPAAGIDCLLIGGFAVNHYGYTRNTLDIDFMIIADQADRLRNIMRENGFTNIDVRNNVIFFSNPTGGPRVDFLTVDASTMHNLLVNAVEITFERVQVKLPCLKDLLAMKIFALAQNTACRMGKDLPDIAYLSVLNQIDPERDLKPLCDRFGTPEVYQLICNQMEGLRQP